MERSTMGKTSTVTVSLPQKNMNNIYLRTGIGTHQETRNRNTAASSAAMDDSTEISIFDAEKYFNELSVLEAPKQPGNIGLSGGSGNRVTPAENIAAVKGAGFEPQRFSSVDGYTNFYRNYRTRSFRSAATPTASSEASWNSQTGLLSVPPGSMAVSMRNPAGNDKKTRGGISQSSPTATPPSLGWRLGLRKKCPCSCKESVQVKDKSVRRKGENSLSLQHPPPPPPPHVMLRSSSKSSGSTTASSMADLRLTCNGNTTISMEKVRHDSFQENWYQQSRRSRSNSRDTRSFSSASTENIIPPKLQAMGIRTSFTDQRVGNSHGISATTSTNNSSNASGFTFPILGVNSGIKLKDPAMEAANVVSSCKVDKDPARDSLEIFRPASHELNPPSRKNTDHFMRLDRGNTHLSFPASPNSRAKSGNADVIDDGASDESSDLFEIESFSTTQTTTTATSTTTTAHAPAAAMFLYRREVMEEPAMGGGSGASTTSSFGGIRGGGRFGSNVPVVGLYEQHRRASLEEPMTPTTECCYEPSEASIDWSVTTAEGFDRASVANASEADFGEFTEPPPPPPEKSRRRSSGNGLLMSCRCEKAVNVGRPVPRAAKPVGPASGGYAGEHGRQVGPGMSLSSSSTLAMWAVGHKV